MTPAQQALAQYNRVGTVSAVEDASPHRLIQLLLERGTDPTVVSKTGVTGLDLARQYKNEPVVRFLESRR